MKNSTSFVSTFMSFVHKDNAIVKKSDNKWIKITFWFFWSPFTTFENLWRSKGTVLDEKQETNLISDSEGFQSSSNNLKLKRKSRKSNSKEYRNSPIIWKK